MGINEPAQALCVGYGPRLPFCLLAALRLRQIQLSHQPRPVRSGAQLSAVPYTHRERDCWIALVNGAFPPICCRIQIAAYPIESRARPLTAEGIRRQLLNHLLSAFCFPIAMDQCSQHAGRGRNESSFLQGASCVLQISPQELKRAQRQMGKPRS